MLTAGGVETDPHPFDTSSLSCSVDVLIGRSKFPYKSSAEQRAIQLIPLALARETHTDDKVFGTFIHNTLHEVRHWQLPPNCTEDNKAALCLLVGAIAPKLITIMSGLVTPLRDKLAEGLINTCPDILHW